MSAVRPQAIGGPPQEGYPADLDRQYYADPLVRIRARLDLCAAAGPKQLPVVCSRCRERGCPVEILGYLAPGVWIEPIVLPVRNRGTRRMPSPWGSSHEPPLGWTYECRCRKCEKRDGRRQRYRYARRTLALAYAKVADRLAAYPRAEPAILAGVDTAGLPPSLRGSLGAA